MKFSVFSSVPNLVWWWSFFLGTSKALIYLLMGMELSSLRTLGWLNMWVFDFLKWLIMLQVYEYIIWLKEGCCIQLLSYWFVIFVHLQCWSKVLFLINIRNVKYAYQECSNKKIPNLIENMSVHSVVGSYFTAS